MVFFAKRIIRKIDISDVFIFVGLAGIFEGVRVVCSLHYAILTVGIIIFIIGLTLNMFGKKGD